MVPPLTGIPHVPLGARTSSGARSASGRAGPIVGVREFRPAAAGLFGGPVAQVPDADYAPLGFGRDPADRAETRPGFGRNTPAVSFNLGAGKTLKT